MKFLVHVVILVICLGIDQCVKRYLQELEEVRAVQC